MEATTLPQPQLPAVRIENATVLVVEQLEGRVHPKNGRALNGFSAHLSTCDFFQVFPASQVGMVHFARVLCAIFDVAQPLLSRWHSGHHSRANVNQLGQLGQVLAESLCTLSRELASRHLLRNSFLEQHWESLQIPEDRGRSFPLLFDWGKRLVLRLDSSWIILIDFGDLGSGCWRT